MSAGNELNIAEGKKYISAYQNMNNVFANGSI